MPKATINSLPGEQPGEKIVRLFKHFVGCSLTNRRSELGKLVSREVDNPEVVVTIATNCGTSALGIMALAGVQHALLDKHYVSGAAISWCLKIGYDLGALRDVRNSKGVIPPVGSLLHYNTEGTNNDHVEWLLSKPDEHGNAIHGGGGRVGNALGMSGPSNIWLNNNRPLVAYIDPDLLGIEVVPAGSDINEAYPDD